MAKTPRMFEQFGITPSTAPSSPKEGQIYQDSSNGKLYHRYSAAWVEVGGGTGGLSAYSAGTAYISSPADVIYYTDNKIYKCVTNTSAGESPASHPAKWQVLSYESNPLDDISILSNLGLSASVGANALTVAAKQSNGSSDATVGNPITIGFRNTSLTTGGASFLTITSSLSMIVPSGATLGMVNGVQQKHWIYALNNAGTIELAISGVRFDESILQTTTALSAASDSISTLYSTTARTNVPIRLIGYIISTQTTAGTWTSNPTVIFAGPSANMDSEKIVAKYGISGSSSNLSIAGSSTEILDFDTKIFDTHNAVVVGSSWKFVAPRDSYYSVNANCLLYSSYPDQKTSAIAFYKNGNVSRYIEWTSSGTNGIAMAGDDLIYLNAGEYLDCRCVNGDTSAHSINNSTSFYTITIHSI